jgi:hypothetical protein
LCPPLSEAYHPPAMPNMTQTPPAPAAEIAPAPAEAATPLVKNSTLEKVKVAGAAVVAFAGGWQLTEWAVEAYKPVVNFLSSVVTTVANFVVSAAELVKDVAVDMWNAGVATLSAVDGFAHAHPWVAMAAVGAAAAGAAWHFRGEVDEQACDVDGTPPAVAEAEAADDMELSA